MVQLAQRAAALIGAPRARHRAAHAVPGAHQEPQPGDLGSMMRRRRSCSALAHRRRADRPAPAPVCHAARRRGGGSRFAVSGARASCCSSLHHVHGGDRASASGATTSPSAGRSGSSTSSGGSASATPARSSRRSCSCSSSVAHQHQPLRRGDDALRRHAGRALSAAASRAAVVLLLARPVPVDDGRVAAVSQRAAVGRRRGRAPTSRSRCCSGTWACSPTWRALRDTRRRAAPHHLRLLALGWRGSVGTAGTIALVYGLLAGIATPLVLSVHSIVSSDFAIALRARVALDDLPAVLRRGRHLLGLRDGGSRCSSPRAASSSSTT